MLFFALILRLCYSNNSLFFIQFRLVNVKFDLNKAKVRRWFWPQIMIEEKRGKALVKRVVLCTEEIIRLNLCFTSWTIEEFAALTFFHCFCVKTKIMCPHDSYRNDIRVIISMVVSRVKYFTQIVLYYRKQNSFPFLDLVYSPLQFFPMY